MSISALFASCAALVAAVSNTASNVSVIALVGNTVNLSCSTSSRLPVDIYYQRGHGPSPLPLYANGIVLERRYDVQAASSHGQCHGDDDSGHQHTRTPGLERQGLNTIVKN